MGKSSFWGKYARFLSGEHNLSDEKEINDCLDTEKENRNVHRELEFLWKNLKIRGRSWDSRRAWLKMKHKIEYSGRDDNKKRKSFFGDKRPACGEKRRAISFRSVRHLGSFSLIAAAFILMVFSVYTIKHFVGNRQESLIDDNVYEVLIHTGKGQLGSIVVDSDTRIKSSVDTQILRLSTSKKSDWNLKLEGEAYFEVAKDKFDLFYVSTRHVTIQVVGTEFNIRDYPEEDFSEVVVAEGSVVIYHSREEAQSYSGGVILEASDYARISKEGELIVQRAVPIDIHLAWLNRELVFKNATFGNIVLQIERWYNVKIDFVDDQIRDLRLTARFENESLNEVLEVLSLALDLKYDIIDRKVVFYKSSDGHNKK